MPDKPLEILHLKALRLEHFLDKNGRRDHSILLKLVEHVFGDLRYHIAADVNAELLFFLDEQQPLVSFPLWIKPHLLGVIARPAPAVPEKKLQIDLSAAIDELLLAH